MHSVLPFLLAMVAAIVLLEMLATKIRVAYPILLVVAGLLLGFIPGLPALHINPDMIFLLFLPPLLFEAAWSVSFKEMKKWWRIITSFAFLVVFVTAFTVALVANHFIPGFTLPLGFLLGGIVSPPDAVSAAAIMKFVKVPKSTAAILEGESLLNDASSLIIFRFALVAVGTGQFIFHQAALGFVWTVLGGAGMGLLLGWLFVQAHKKLPTDAASDIAFTIIEPYFLYWAAEQLHCSGVLAVVMGGLYMANRRMQFLNSSSRLKAYNVWESFVFILNGLVFLIIGLGMPEIVAGLRSKGVPLSTAIGYGVLVTGILILTRIICSYAALITTYIFRRQVMPRGTRRRQMVLPLVLGWTGMRGVVSLAAALAIPVSLSDGSDFPQRDLILFITFMAILLTLVIQGLTLPFIIRKTRAFEVFDEETEEHARRRVLAGLRDHTHAFLQGMCVGALKDNPPLQKLLHHWEDQMKASNESWLTENNRRVYLDLLDSQRNYLIELNRDPRLDEEIIRTQLYQIDLDEEKVKMMM